MKKLTLMNVNLEMKAAHYKRFCDLAKAISSHLGREATVDEALEVIVAAGLSTKDDELVRFARPNEEPICHWLDLGPFVRATARPMEL